MAAVMCKVNCTVCKLWVHAMLTVLALSVEVRGANESIERARSSSNWRKDLRWLIQRVHPMNSARAPHGLSKPRIIQSRNDKSAFAADKQSIGRPYVKGSKEDRRKNYIKNINSLLKEKEDVFVQSRLCSLSVDLAFVMDDCGTKPFHICREFVKETIKNLKDSGINTRVGVVMYSKKETTLFGFNYFRKIQDVLDALDRIQFTSKQSRKAENIGAALTTAQRMLFTGSRSGVPQVLVLITGARANDDVNKPSRRLRQDGVVIYGAGFGNGFDRSQLEAISSKPSQEYVFVEDPRLTNSFTWTLRNNVCKGETGVVKEGYIQRYQGPSNVVFLLDGSGDLGFKEMQYYKTFVKEVYDNIYIPRGGVEFGLTECGTRYYSQADILTRSFQNSRLLDHTLDNLVPMNGNCELGKTLQMINAEVFQRIPEDAPKVLVVVLRGHSLDNATSVANELSKKGARIVALGAGSQADMEQVVNIADSPLYAFKVPVFKYLPSMVSTVVGFINEVTKPTYVSNSFSPSREAASAPGYHTKMNYFDDSSDMNSNDVDTTDPNHGNGLFPGLRPILSELDGEDSDSWSFLLQSSEKQQDFPRPNQNTDSQKPQATEGHKEYEESMENDKNRLDTHYAVAGQEGTQLDYGDFENSHNLQESSPSFQDKETQKLSSSNAAAQPVNAEQSGNVFSPVPQTMAGVTSPNQGTGNQKNGSQGAVISPNGGTGSRNGGTSLGSSGNQAVSPENAAGVNQGTGTQTQGAVTSPSNGASASNNEGGNSGTSVIRPNSGSSGTATGNVAGVPGNSGQQAGPMQVIQAQLLPIPVLPVQTIPVQSLTSIQTPQGQGPASNNKPPTTNLQQPETNPSKNLKGANNEMVIGPNQAKPGTDSSAKEGPNQAKPGIGSSAKEGPNPTKPGTGSSPTEGPNPTKPGTGSSANEVPNPTKLGTSSPTTIANKVPEGKGTPAPETEKPKGNPSLPGPLPSPSSKKPSNPTTPQSAAKPTKGKSSSNVLPPTKNQNVNITPSSQNNKSGTQKPTSSSLASRKTTSNSPTIGVPGKGTVPASKPNSPSTKKSSQKPQVVLCQIVCGSDCCSPILKVATTPTTPKTKPTTLPPTSAKSDTKRKSTTPPEVIVGPPLPLRYPQGPGWFPNRAHPLPVGAAPWPDAPLSASSMYIKLPPATASSVVHTEKTTTEPILFGQCQDYHPDCPSFVMSGMCDQEAPFKEAFNVREVCMLSCGVCNSFIKHGNKVTFDVRDKERKPEDIGFPEYSKKFLKRQVRARRGS